MGSCFNIQFPSLDLRGSPTLRAAYNLPWRASADRVKAFVLRGEVKDFFKFWGRLNDFMGLAEVRDYYLPSLPHIAVWTKQWDYMDVFFRKLPRFKAALLDAWEKKTLTRNLALQTINFGGGAIKLSARWLQKGSICGRLGLPITALTATAFGVHQVTELSAITAKELKFDLDVAQRYRSQIAADGDNEALFKEIKGAYNERAAEILVNELKPNSAVTQKMVQHIKAHIRRDGYQKASEATHSLLGGGFVTYACIMGMGPIASGALLALMLTSYIAASVIHRMAAPQALELSDVKIA